MKNNFVLILFFFLFAQSIKAGNYDVCISVTPGTNGGSISISLKNNTAATILVTNLEVTVSASNPVVTVTGTLNNRFADVGIYNIAPGASQTLISGSYSVPTGTSGTSNFTMSSPYLEVNGNVATATIACSATNISLPVELISLKATPIGKAVQLDWITASEKNSSHYEIERSADAKAYTTLGKVEANGNSFSKLSYVFTDEKPLSGINYYRLKMVDKDESYEYSKIVSASFNTPFQKIAIKAYPNPASYTIAVEPFEGFKSLNIYSLQGALLMKSTTVEANISSLNTGIYFLEVENTEGYVSRVKFVKN